MADNKRTYEGVYNALKQISDEEGVDFGLDAMSQEDFKKKYFTGPGNIENLYHRLNKISDEEGIDFGQGTRDEWLSSFGYKRNTGENQNKYKYLTLEGKTVGTKPASIKPQGVGTPAGGPGIFGKMQQQVDERLQQARNAAKEAKETKVPYTGETVNAEDGYIFTEAGLDSVENGATPVYQPSGNDNEPQQAVPQPRQRQASSYGVPFKPDSQLTAAQRDDIVRRNNYAAQQAERLTKEYEKEQARRNQPLVDTGDEKVNNSIIKTQGQWEDELDKGVRELGSKYVAPMVDKAMKDADAKYATVLMDMSKATMGAPSGMAPMSAIRMANEATDPEKILQALQTSLSGLFGNPEMVADIEKRANALGVPIDEYAEKVVAPSLMQDLQQRFDQSQIAKYLPKNTTDYILGGVSNTILGKLIDAATETKAQRYYKNQAEAMTEEGNNPYYKPGTGAKLSKVGVEFGGDGGFFGLFGKVSGKVAVNLAERQIKKMMAKGLSEGAARSIVGSALENSVGARMKNYLMQHIVSSSLTMGQYNLTSEAARQMRDREFDPGQLASTTVEGLAVGAAFGTTGGVTQALSQPLSGFAKVGAKVAGFGAEAETMYATEELSKMAHGEEGFTNPFEGSVEAMMKLGVMKLSSPEGLTKALGEVLHPVKSNTRQQTGVKFSNEDLDYLRNSTEGQNLMESLSNMHPETSIREFNGKKELTEEGKKLRQQLSENYDDFMSNKEIPASVKQKVAGVLGGVYHPGLETSADIIQNEDGTATVKTRDKDGNLIQDIKFDNYDEAQQRWNGLMSQFKRNDAVNMWNNATPEQRAQIVQDVRDEISGQKKIDEMVARADGMTQNRLRRELEKINEATKQFEGRELTDEEAVSYIQKVIKDGGDEVFNDLYQMIHDKAVPADELNIKRNYWEGTQMSPEQYHQAKLEAQRAEDALYMMGGDFAEEVIGAAEYPDEKMAELAGRQDINGKQLQAALRYYNLASKANGMMDEALKSVDQQVEAANAVVRRNTHTGSGQFVEVTADGRDYYLTAGKVQINPDGTLDTKESGDALILRDKETGEIEVKSPVRLRVTAITDPSKIIAENESMEGLRGQLMKQAEDNIEYAPSTPEEPQPGDVFLDAEGKPNMAVQMQDGTWVKQPLDEQGEPMGEPLPLDIEEYRSAKSAEIDDLYAPQEETPVENAGESLENAGESLENAGESLEKTGERTGENEATPGETGERIGENGEITGEFPLNTPKIPSDEKGRLQYDKAKPEDTLAELNKVHGEETAQKMIAQMAANTTKKLEELQKKDVSDITDMDELDAYYREVAEMQRKADYWQGLIKRSKQANETEETETNTVGKWSLSEKKAGNGEPFYQDENGNIDLVDIPQEVFDEIGYTKAPLRLTPSMLSHVRLQHGKETGITNDQEAIEFITDVMRNFDHVRLGNDGALIFSVENGRSKTGKRAITILLNSDNGEFYGIKTSGYEAVDRLNKRPLLWEGSAKESPSSDAASETVTSLDAQQGGEQSGSASDQSNALSEGKDTEKTNTLQENQQKNDVQESERPETKPGSSDNDGPEPPAAGAGNLKPTAEQKVAQATVKKNIGKRFSFQNQDGTRSEVVINAFKGDDMVETARQDYDASGNAVGEPYAQDLKMVDVGNAIVKGMMKPVKSVEEKLREVYKVKQGDIPILDVLTEDEQLQLLNAIESGDKDKVGQMTGDFIDAHQEDLILRGRDIRNDKINRIMESTASREEKLRRVRKEYQGYDEALQALEDDALYPSSAEDWVIHLHSRVPKSGDGKLAYFSYEQDGKKIIGMKGETGYGNKTGGDTKGFAPWLAPEGKGMSLQKYAEQIHSQLPESEQQKYTDQDIRNAILDVFGSAERPSDIPLMVIKRGVLQAEQAARRMEEMWIDGGVSFQKVHKDFATRLKRGIEITNTEPTEAQKEAGNYRKGHISFGGYDFTIENPAGSMRRGTDQNGKQWEQEMHNTYGYILGTIGKDGDHLDMFLNDAQDLDNWDGTVYVVDQVNPKTGEFDESKVLYGFGSEESARQAYLSNYEEGWKGLGKITGVSKEAFDEWLDSSKRKLKPFADYAAVKKEVAKAPKLTVQQDKVLRDAIAEAMAPEAVIDDKVGQQVLKEYNDQVKLSASSSEDNLDYHKVSDKDLLAQLDSQPTVKRYRAMQLIDGKLYPPMSAKVDGEMREPTEIGVWEQAEERPDLVKNGKFVLRKGQKGQSDVPAAYNPYFHTSTSGLNDQFTSAHRRPELVVEVEIPESELTSGYKAEGAKDAVGDTPWHSGPVNGKLPAGRKRTVTLSRYSKVNRIVPDAEVAEMIAKQLEGTGVEVPYNVVTPALRKELEARGVKVSEQPSGSVGKQPRFQKVSKEPFYSNALKAVEGIKQEKGTAEQWLAMIQKAGGLKAGEDKWIGLSDWLNERKGKSVTKQEIEDYIRKNQIEIEEVDYTEGMSQDAQNKLDALNEEFMDYISEGEMETESIYTSDWVDYAYKKMVEQYGDDFEMAFEIGEGQGTNSRLTPTMDWNDQLTSAAKYFLGMDTNSGRPIHSTRLDYTTEGLQNKKEIALTIPSVEPYNENDEVHFGDAGEGRAVAWIRFGETVDADGKRVLVIDEIQSKRHQDAREKGYKPSKEEIRNQKLKISGIIDKLNEKYPNLYAVGYETDGGRIRATVTEEEYNNLRDEIEILQNMKKNNIPDAPFEKNWHELAMKRMLRYAAENGYDKVAWTTGAQQAERYSLASVVNHIDVSRWGEDSVGDKLEVEQGYKGPSSWVPSNEVEKSIKEYIEYCMSKGDSFGMSVGYAYNQITDAPEESKGWTNEAVYKVAEAIEEELTGYKDARNVSLEMKGEGDYINLVVNREGKIFHASDTDFIGKSLADVVGKDLALKIINTEDKGRINASGLNIGGEGMKGFYDQMLPRFMDKYGKKWGVKTSEVELPELEETARKMWAVDVTPEMKESVMQGQPMFFKTPGGDEAYGFTLGDKIYIDPRIATSETPVHEYGHLWVEMKRRTAPEEWNEIKGIILNDKAVQPFINKVKEEYPELTDDDKFAEEVLTQYSGRKGAEKLRRVAAEIAAENGGVFGKAEAVTALQKMKNILDKFWRGVAKMMGWKYTNAEDIADKMLYDLLSGVDPTKEGAEKADNLKQRQLEIVIRENPMRDDIHTGIRKIEDIKTYEETVKDEPVEDNYTPDYTKEMVDEALKTGKITVYSSYPIKDGTFVTPSKMEAQNYAGGGKVYSEEVSLKDVAWIDPIQGQYARVPDSKMQKVNYNSEEEQKRTKDIFDAAKKLFGTTYDVREAGYVLPDGTMPDFSGRHLMDPGSDTSFLRGRRTTDHREVESIAYEKDGNTRTGIETDMPDFIRRGAIRIDDNAGNINLSTKPTDEQRSILRRLIARNDGYVQVDFGDGWDSDYYVEYDGAKPAKVLADIDRYFDEGIKPQSEPKYQLVGKKGATAADKAEETTIRRDNLKLAREAEKEGMDAHAIKFATGWERGKDGQWRYEIPDADVDIYKWYKDAILTASRREKELYHEYDVLSDRAQRLDERIPARLDSRYTEEQKAKYREMRKMRDDLHDQAMKKRQEWVDYANKNVTGLTTTLEEIIGKDNELFKYYPQLRQMEVKFGGLMGAAGGYNTEEKNIKINPNEFNRFDEKSLNSENVYGTLIHEIQHAVQDIEGFAMGGSLEAAVTPEGLKAIIGKKTEQLERLQREYADNKKTLDSPEFAEYAELAGMTPERYREHLLTKMDKQAYDIDTLKEQIERIEKQKTVSRSDAMDYYRSLAGEVEARNATRRMNYTDEERMTHTAEETEEIPRDQQYVVMGDGGQSMSEKQRFVEEMNDDEKSAVRKRLEETKALPATEGTIVKREDKSARNVAMEWADKHIPEAKTVSTEIGDLVINKKSISDSLAHGFSQAKLDAIPTLLPAFEEGRAVYIGSGKDVNGNPIIDHYFAYPIDYKGNREYVFCRTREDQNTHRLYIHEVITGEDIKNGQTLQSTAPEKPRTGLPLYRNIMSDVFGGKDTENINTLQEKSQKSSIRGLEDYSEEEINNYVRDFVKEQIEMSDADAEIVDIKVIGSRTTGTAKPDSDLDVLVEFKGKEREDDMFNMLAEADEPLVINGIKVDINPIKAGKSGTIAEFLERNADYKKDELLRDGEAQTVSISDNIKLTPKQMRERQAFAERQWKRAHDDAAETVEKLHLTDNVTIVDSIDELDGHENFSDRKKRAKGWYDPETGQITIVMGNHRSPIDVVTTIIHEGVAHHGLRKLFGEERFDTFLDNVYKAASDDIRADIDEIVKTYNGDVRKATEEYLARLAEDTDFERAVNSGWFRRVKDWFVGMLRDLGVPGFSEVNELSDNELRYILWRSYENLAEPGRYKIPAGEKLAKIVEMPVKKNIEDELPKMIMNHNDEISIEKKVRDMSIDEVRAAYKRLDDMMRDENGLDFDEQEEARKQEYFREHGLKGIGKFMADSLQEAMDKYGSGMITLRWELQDRLFGEGRYTVKEGDHELFRDDETGPQPEMTPEERQYWSKWEADMKKWKERNGLPADAERPTERPKMEAGETALGFATRMAKFYRENALWNTAPKIENYRQNRLDKDVLEDARREEKELPNSQGAKMRRVAAELAKIRHAVAQQKAYDKATVKAVTDFAQDFMKMGFGDNLSRGEMERMLSSVKNATGAKDIKQSVDNILNILVDNHLHNLKEQVKKLASVKELKQTAQGVEAQGKLELKGQQMIQEFRDQMGGELVSGVDDVTRTAQEIEGKVAAIKERISTILENMDGSDQDSMWHQRYIGAKLAQMYMESVADSQAQQTFLKGLIKQAQEDYKTSGRSYQAQQELLDSLNQSMLENKIDRIGMYSDVISTLHGNIEESIIGAKEFVEKEARRVKHIHQLANFDLAGKSFRSSRREDKMDRFLKNDIVNLAMAPMATFEQMLKQLGSRNAKGEGALYDYYMSGFMDATENAYLGQKKAHEELDAKAREIFGDEVKRWSDLYKLTNKEGATVKFIDSGDTVTEKLTQGNMLYIYMVNKMSDGKMKLRAMGITEEDVAAIKEAIDPRLVQLGDWLQEEYLAGKREEYNKVHERMFGAPMAAIDHYFPIRVNRDAAYQDADKYITSEEGDKLPSTITGSIIKRTKNSLPLDILHTDAISLALEHVDDMENWAATAEWNRDVKDLLSYTTFRNKVKNMKTVYGSGTPLWNKLFDAATIATGDYNPKRGIADKTLTNIAKGVTQAKISFRAYTAFKQLLSIPAFFHDASAGEMAKAMLPHNYFYNNFKWAMENMPVFEKRWKSRQIGDTRLMDDATDWKLWKNELVSKMNRGGLWMNAIVDAATCAAGAKAIYETRYKKYKAMGASDETAHKQALKEAKIGYNLTQQSSEGAFVSTIQKDRTLAANALTVFRNGPASYTRQTVDAMRNLEKRRHKGYKEDSINFMAKQFEERLGLDADKARQAAELEYNRAGLHEVAKLLNMMFGVTIAWNLGASLPYLLFGDDDETKEEMLMDALLKGVAAGPVEGLAGGNIWSDFMGRVLSEETRKAYSEGGFGAAFDAALKQGGDYEVNPLPLMADLQNMIKKMGYDKFAAAQDVFNICMQSAVGVNPQTFTDMFNACMDYAAPGWDGTSYTFDADNMSRAKEVALFIMRLMNAPTSSWRNKYIDELGMTVEDGKKLSYDEMAKRYAHYKHWKDVPMMGWLRGEEGREEKMEKIRKQFDKEVKKRMARVDYEDLQEDLINTEDEAEKKRIIGAMKDQTKALDNKELLKMQSAAKDSAERKMLQGVVVKRAKEESGVLSDDALHDSINSTSSVDKKNEFIKEYAKRQGAKDDFGKANSNDTYKRLRTYEDVKEDIMLSDLKKKIKDIGNPGIRKFLNGKVNKVYNQRKALRGDAEATSEMMKDLRQWRKEAIEALMKAGENGD